MSTLSEWRKSQPHLELEASIKGEIKRVDIPSYSLRYPSYDRVSLPAVKTTIYHPETSFGSIQKNQNDNHLSKFPIDNSKSSTNLDNEKFVYDQTNLNSKISYPIRLIGDVDEAMKLKNMTHQSYYFDGDIKEASKKNFNPSVEKKCISGYEDLNRFENHKIKQQFRFNRIRMVPDDTPSDGRLPCYFNMNPGLDKFGRRVEANTSSQYRNNDGAKYSTGFKTEPFKPYGYTSSQYNNYIMGFPRF